MHLIGWFADHVLGAAAGPSNFLWGGFLSCLSEFAVVGALWHGVNCHEKGCWRLGHNVNGTRACHRHRKGLLPGKY